MNKDIYRYIYIFIFISLFEGEEWKEGAVVCFCFFAEPCTVGEG